ncbi:MAG: preprotein translocase subunit SecG [Spirochaetia bacterium]|nr:preprotein translocase subunit SecG [Spirochaetia bacterium]
MEMLSSILTVIFIINSVLVILIILIQSNRSAGMGIFGGGSQSAFGSSSADVLTKITGIMVTLFIVLGFSLAFIKSKSGGAEELRKELERERQETSAQKENEAAETQEQPALSGPPVEETNQVENQKEDSSSN